MTPIPLKRLAIILITVLITIQGASALTIERAPLNPAFVAYTEEQNSDPVMLFSAERSIEPDPEEETEPPYMTGLIPAPGAPVWPDGFTAETSTVEQPGTFDLRYENNRITPVRDQGKAGSCWAFAPYGSLESTWLTDSGEAENFSENNMKNLCSNEYTDGFDRTPYDGGYASAATAYLTRGSGPVREEDDRYALPYPSNESSTDLSPVLDVLDITYLPPRTGPLDNGLIKQTLREEGALWVSFTVNRSCFADNYTTYYWPGEEYAIDGGHAVTLVGWNDTFPKESFAVKPPDDGAFILKNSWGTNVGEGGYFYISYYDPVIGYFKGTTQSPYDFSYNNTAAALYTGVRADPDKHIYQYDPLGWTTSISTGTDTSYGANVFTAERYEELTDVSFYTREPGTDYTVAIFKNFATPPGGDVAPVAWVSGTADLPGYHTITLPDSVPLIPGEVFSVVLEVSSPTDTHPLVVEQPIAGYSSGATAQAGESYVSGDGDSWSDLTDIDDFEDTNVCIKAHTRPVTVVPWDYPTIQDAVNAAADGDTIFVKSGTYPEALWLNKNVTLIGVGMPVVATPEGVGTGATIWTDNITLTGFSFEGNGEWDTGISVYGNNSTISDCRCTGYQTGIIIGLCKGLSLSETSLYNNGYNLWYLNKQENPGNTIAETVTVNGKPVIYRESISGETIDASSDAGAVICVNCTDITIRDITTEPVTDSIFLLASEDVIVERVTANAAYYGVNAYKSENITVRDSSFGPDMESCIQFDQISRALAEGNEIACHEYGMAIEYKNSKNITVSDNTITGGGAGVRGSSSDNCSISGNTISDCLWSGIMTDGTDTLTVTNNMVDTSGTGIHTWNMRDIRVSDNTIRCNDAGNGMIISADGAVITSNTADNCMVMATMELNNSVVYGNRFSGAEYPEINLSDSGENVFVYRNDFIVTGGYTVAEERPNGPVWHSPTAETYWYHKNPFTQVIGNYWSTYNGTDTNHNGIGETPFSIHVNETDPFPLIEPISQYLNHATSTPSNDNPSTDMATSGALNAGESATLTFTGSAVQTVTITAAGKTRGILLTVDHAKNGPDGLEGAVYEYLSANLRGITDDGIEGAEFSFRIPATWLREEGLAPVDMALWRFHDDAWQELPTSVLREEGGWVYFEAVSPGFSSFAIAESEGQNVGTETGAVVPDAETDTVDIAVTGASGNETTTETPVTVAIPEVKGNPAESATTPQGSPIGFITVIGGAAGALLLFRRR